MNNAEDIRNLVVEVLNNRGSDKNQDWLQGSGFFVGKNLVLTAFHNVQGASELFVRCILRGAEKFPAKVLLQGDKNIDLALLEVSNMEVDAPRLHYGKVDQSVSALVGQCWAIGFPRFKEKMYENKPLRDSAQVDGEIPTGDYLKSASLKQPLLALRVKNSPRPLPSGPIPESEWAGISGAVVLSGSNIIVGVITEHHLSEGESTLTAVPITAVDRLPEAVATRWWELLGVDRQQFVRLPDRETILNDDELFVLAYIMTDPQATTKGAWLIPLHQQITYRGYTDMQATSILAGLEDKGIIKHVDVPTYDRLEKRKAEAPAYKITPEGIRFIQQNNKLIPIIKSVYEYEIRLYGSEKYNQKFLEHIKDLAFVQQQTRFIRDDDKTQCSIFLFAYKPIDRKDIEHIASIYKTKIYSFKEKT